MKIKTKINKWDLIKLKSFAQQKKSYNKMKRRPSEWEKIFANESDNKRLTSKIGKELMQLDIKRNNSVRKWIEDLNRHFSKEDIKMAHEKMSNIIVIEMQIKTAMKYHLTLVRMALIKKSTKKKSSSLSHLLSFNTH